MTRALPTLLLVLACAVAAAGCGGEGDGGARKTLLVAVNAPFSTTPYVGTTIDRGVTLAASDINDRGGVAVGGESYDLRVKRLDNALSPRRALQNVRRAVGDGAVAIVDEGTGIDATWEVAGRDDVPIGIVYQGGEDLADAEGRPNVFRVAPTNHGLAFRLAEYVIPKRLKVALLHDDSGYGEAGAASLRKAFSRNAEAVAASITLPAGALDVAPQVLRARGAGATALIVWGLPPTIAAAVTAVRTAGWDVPVFTPPAGADPLVRQQLADSYVKLQVARYTNQRAMAKIRAGQLPGPEMSIAKLSMTQNFQRLADMLSAMLGPRLTADTGEWGTYAFGELVLGVPGMRVAGGTDEVMRNIVGERVLGLPKEPRANA